MPGAASSKGLLQCLWGLIMQASSDFPKSSFSFYPGPLNSFGSCADSSNDCGGECYDGYFTGCLQRL